MAMRIKEYVLTGVFTTCKLCRERKDDCFFKQQGGKRVGLVCRACDLDIKRNLYHSDQTHRLRTIAKAHAHYSANREQHSKATKAYREENAELIRQKKAAYHKANAHKLNAKSRSWYQENKDRHRTVGDAYRAKHAERLAKIAADHYAANKEIFAERRRAWMREHPRMMTFYSRSYQAACLQRTPPWADMAAIKVFYANTPYGFTVDHIVPLRGKLVSGLHVENNLQYLTQSENSKKRNKFNPNDYTHDH